MKHVQIEHRDKIAIVTFDRGNAANPLSYQLMRELTEAARSFEDDHQTAAIILSGRKDNFTLGFDLKDPEVKRLQDARLAERRVMVTTGKRMCQAWEDLQPLTISALEGWCVGGGVALSVATDLRIISRPGGMYVPEVERGMNMSWGSVPRIVNLVGPARAKRIIVLAEKMSAVRAVEFGLADEMVEAGTTLDFALEMAKRAAQMPPVALRMCKRDINAYTNALAAVASHGDFDDFTLASGSQDGMEGMASFLEKRPPKFDGN
ncbi:MAG: enoyl-CoA hydratase/isomerase family protein [Rhizobiaceae bacterium]